MSSWFKYGNGLLDQKPYLVVTLLEEGRADIEAEIAKGLADRLVIRAGDIDNLEFLSRCLDGGPKELLIQTNVGSLIGLEKLTNLIDFKFDLDSGKPFPDYSKLTNLERLFLSWDKKYDAKVYQHGLFTLPKLKDLTLRYWTKPDCKEIAQLKQLERLDLRQGALVCLDGLENCSGLKELHLSYLVKLTDINRLDDLQNLEKIHIENCPNISDYASMIRLKNLKHIHMDKVKAQFENLEWLNGLHQLERICLSEKISQIDWNILFNHPSLKKVAIPSHEGYKVSDAEILKIAESAKRKIKDFKRLGTKKKPSFVFDLE